MVQPTIGKVLIEQRNLSVNVQGVLTKQCWLCGKRPQPICKYDGSVH